MNLLRYPTRRGVALLLVLATFLIVVTAVTILVQTAAAIQARKSIDHHTRLADDLLDASQAPIKQWLIERSTSIVIPAEQSPMVEVLHDSWVVDDLKVDLTITAFDQLGMVPLEAARGGWPLRLTLPQEILRQIDGSLRLGSEPTGAINAPGLDWFTGLDSSDPTSRVFPDGVKSVAVSFGRLPETIPAVGVGIVAVRESSNPGAGAGAGPGALGECIATHNTNPQRININTAPMPLVEAAMRLAGRGGLEQVITARKAGKPANIGAAAAPGSGSPDMQRFIPQIVATSNCWAFRVDIRIETLERSWWMVYQPAGNLPWMCVQRLAITE